LQVFHGWSFDVQGHVLVNGRRLLSKEPSGDWKEENQPPGELLALAVEVAAGISEKLQDGI